MGVTINHKTASTAPSWLKTGMASKQAFAHEQHKTEQAKADSERMFRFWLKVGDERQVTFLDGTLDSDGMLEFVSFYEHSISVTPKEWNDYVCVAEQEICPICNDGDRPSYVGVFTVIDHTAHTIQKGPNAGKVIKDQRKLYVAKQTTLRTLQHLAGKRGGLAGHTIEISRLDEKKAKVGDTFQFLNKRTAAELLAAYGDNAAPADYAKELNFMTAAELIKAGIGKAPSGPGFEKAGVIPSDAAEKM